MKSLILLSLIVFCFSELKVLPPLKIADVFGGVKKQIYECISKSSEASETLKAEAKKSLETNERLNLYFQNIELTQEDREVIRNCKRDAFRAKTRKPDNNVTPISLENLVHRKKIQIVKGTPQPPRKLGIIDGIIDGIVINIGSFKISIGGIFTCLEEAQPAISILRNTINLWRSQDFTGAVINVYDNFSPISEGFSVCIKSIFPS